MSISVVQRSTGVDTHASGSVSVPFPSGVTSGNDLIAIGFVSGSTNAFSTPTDTLGNKYYSVYSANNGGVLGLQAWVAYNTSGGANSISLSDSNSYSTLHIYEVSGLATGGNAFDVGASSAQSSATSLTSGNVTTNDANELLLGLSCNTHGNSPPSYTAGSGYVFLQTQNLPACNSATEEQIVSSTGTYAGTFTLGTNTDSELTAIITLSSVSTGTSTSTSSTSTSSTSTSVSSTSSSTSISSTSTSQSSTSSSTSESTSTSTSTSTSSTSTSTSYSSTSSSTSISSTSSSISSTSSSTSSTTSTSISSTSTSISTTASTSLSTSLSTTISSTSSSTSISSTSTSTTLPVVFDQSLVAGTVALQPLLTEINAGQNVLVNDSGYKVNDSGAPSGGNVTPVASYGSGVDEAKGAGKIERQR